MKKLLVLATICAMPFATYVFAQDKPASSKPRYSATEMRKLKSDAISRSCFLADKTEHLVNTTVTVAGKTYRCVTVLDENLNRIGEAWTPVSTEPANGR
jgi:hypothetical protein